MSWSRALITILTLLDAGWMTFDGARALLVGDYVTPRHGPHAGQLGPWHRVVGALGIPPRSTAMKCIFLGQGLAWLAILACWLAGATWGRGAMLVAAALSFWNLVAGALLGAVILLLLLIAP